MSLLRSATRRAIKHRSLFIKVDPIPETLAERRAVLHALKQFGKIEVFKKKHQGTSFICVAGSTTVANALIEKSPMAFDFRDTPDEKLLSLSSHASSTASYNANGETSDPDAKTADLTVEGKHSNDIAEDPHRAFTVSVFPLDKYNHLEAIRMDPLYGAWPEERSPFDKQAFKVGSPASAALRFAIPNDMASKGLRDWETGTSLGIVHRLTSSPTHFFEQRDRRRKAPQDQLTEAISPSRETKREIPQD